MSAVPKSRDPRIDALKFFAIALVVFTHVAALPRYHGALRSVEYAIRSFNMPLFMLLAGYVLFGREGTDPWTFVRKKFLALMVPYFAWAFIVLVMWRPPSTWLPSMLQAAINPHAPERLWFLYVLFVFYVMFTLVRMASTRDWVLVAVAFATVGLTFLPAADYFGRDNVQWLFAFFVAGYLAAKHASSLPQARLWMVLAAAALFGGLLAIGSLPADGATWPPWFMSRYQTFFFAQPGLATPSFVAWKYATAFAGIALSAMVYALAGPRFVGVQEFPGRHSLGIYVTQGIMLPICFGAGWLALLGSWALVLYVALAVALLLERGAWTRVILLGKPRGARAAAPSTHEAGSARAS